MRTQCKRIYSALPTHCDRICNGRCDEPCVSDASPEPIAQSPDLGPGPFSSKPLIQFSPDPVSSSVAREVWHHLTAGLRMLSENDHGRDWPLPRRDRLRALLAEFPDDLCAQAAREAREIVQAQDRAPNITGLFEHRLRELAKVRATVRESLEGPVAA